MAQPVSTEVYSRDAVYRQMRRQIIDFTLLPGELLSENTLAAQITPAARRCGRPSPAWPASIVWKSFRSAARRSAGSPCS